MPRELSSELQIALAGSLVHLAVLFEVQFSATTLRLWTGNGALVWNDQVYLGNGWFTGYTTSSDTQDIRSEGFTVTLTAVPLEVAALILNEARQYLPGRLYLCALDTIGIVIPQPFQMCEGFLDVPEFAVDASSGSVQLAFESDVHDLDSPNESRYTDGEQQRMFPGDKALEHVVGIQDKRIFWGIPGELPKA